MFKNQDFITVTAQTKIELHENYSNEIYRMSVLLFSSTNQKCQTCSILTYEIVLPDVIKRKNVIHVKHCLLLLLRGFNLDLDLICLTLLILLGESI